MSSRGEATKDRSASAKSSPLKPVFSALSRHADVVEHALHELVGVDAGEALSDPAVRVLREFNVLRPAGENGYRLHSRLREFANDVLQIYPAYQSFTGVGQLVEQLPLVWNELQDMRIASDFRQADEAAAQIERDAFDISDLVERNLRQLGLRLSIRFGNVHTLAAKIGQIRFYQRQSEGMANDLSRLTRVVDKIENEVRERGLQALAAMLRNTLLSQLPRWTQTLSQYQSQMRRELFSIREVERKNVLLARTAMLLRQNPAWRSLDDVLLPDEVAPFLLSKPILGAPLPPIRVQMDPLDDDRLMRELMRDEVRSMPQAPATHAAPAPKAPPLKRLPPKKPTRPESTPAMRALARLAAAVIAQDAAPSNDAALSLFDWRAGDADAMKIAPDLWLAFAVSGLRTYRFRVALVSEPPAPGERFRHTFSDALARTTPEAVKLYPRTLGRQLDAKALPGRVPTPLPAPPRLPHEIDEALP